MSTINLKTHRRLRPEVGSSDHTLGPTGAPITLVEFGDYACSFCTETYPVVEKLRSDMDGDLRFVYRHFPVTSPARSRRAAEAAEAAAGQDRFWQMHDLLSTEPGAHLHRRSASRTGRVARSGHGVVRRRAPKKTGMRRVSRNTSTTSGKQRGQRSHIFRQRRALRGTAARRDVARFCGGKRRSIECCTAVTRKFLPDYASKHIKCKPEIVCL